MSKQKDKDEKKVRYQPAGVHRRPLFGEGKSKLDHERKFLWKWIFSHLSEYKGRYVLFGAFLVFGSIIMSFSPLISKTIIDNALIPKNYQFLLQLSLIYLVLMLITGIFSFIGQYMMQKIGQNIIYEIRNELITKLQGMSMSYFDTHLSGDIISITTNDVDQLNMLVGSQLIQIITSFVSLAFNIIFMLVLNWVLALFALLVIPIYLIATRVFKKVVTGAFKDVRKKMSGVTSSIQENIAGAKVVQAFGQEEKAASEFDRANMANYQAGLKVRKIMSTFFPLIGLISSALTSLVLYIGGWFSIENFIIFGLVMTPGTLSAFNGFLAQFFRPFMTLMQFQQIIESAMAAADRIYGLLEEESELPDPRNPKQVSKKGTIEFKEVSFGYRFVETNHTHVNSKTKPNNAQKIPDYKNKKLPMKPGGFNPMEIMKRVQAFMQSLPEPYKSYFAKNMGQFPVEIRRNLMMQLMGTDPKNATNVIDRVFKNHGFAIPGTKFADTHPELDTEIPLDKEAQMMMPFMMNNKNLAINMENQVKDTDKDQNRTKPPIGFGGMMNVDMLVKLAKNLEKQIAPTMGPGGGMGAGGEGMGGGGGGKMPNIGGPENMVRMLASMPIPEEAYEKFPEVVKKAIKEERILIEREKSSGFVLKNINAKIEAGQTVALVGETGAGKTTFIKLISRFYDVTKGNINLDGVNIKNVKKEDLRRIIGMVPQDSFLFVGSIKENLLYGLDEVTPEIEEKMLDVSKLLGLHNFVEALPEKYDTMLKENASNISIGQRQLIAVARALMTDPVVLILDEATSSVDPYTETLIQDALDNARKGRTTIIIAHRLSTIKNADWIFVLDKEHKGIIEQGTHESLIQANGIYKKLIDMQKMDVKANN